MWYAYNRPTITSTAIVNASPTTPWTASFGYALNALVTNGGNVYVCITAGTSAASGGPTGTGSNITDNTVHWAYVAPPAFVTDATALTNGRPADATRIQWLGAVAGIGDAVQIQLNWSTAIPAGLAGIIGMNAIGLSSSAGIKVAFAGKRIGDTGFPYALGGNCAGQRTVARGDGSVLALGFPANFTPIIGLAITIYNDQNGASWATGGQFVDLGDAWGSPAFEINTDADWKLSYKDTGTSAATPRRSINNQPWPIEYPPARVLECKRAQITFADAFIDGSNPSYQTLRTLTGNGQVSIQIPRYLDSTGALDVSSAHATAVFGCSNFAEMDRAVGDYFSISWTHQEIPALCA